MNAQTSIVATLAIAVSLIVIAPAGVVPDASAAAPADLDTFVSTPLTDASQKTASDASTEGSADDSGTTGSDRATIQTRTLDNGLTIVAISDPSLPIATVELAVRHGAFAENETFNGLSHLYEHMCFKANETLPNQEAFLQRRRELGIVFNGTTSTERVNYFFTLPSDRLKPGLEFMSDAVRTPLFKPGEFTKEKKVVLSEYNRAESSPSFRLRQQMRQAMWGDLDHRKNVLGDREVIKNATIEQMKEIQRTYYIPNNAAVLIAGDVTPDRAFKLGKKVFGDWERGDDPFDTHPVPEHKPMSESKFVVAEGDVSVPTVQFGFQGPSVDEDPDMTYAADVLSFVVGQSTSRFHKRLVDDGPTLGVGFSYFTQRHTGPIYASAEANTDNLKQAIHDLYVELNRLTDPDYFTDEQLENAKTILATRELYSREKTSAYAQTISFWWAVDGIDYYRDYVSNLRDVTRQDIKEYIQRYIVEKPYALGVLVNADDRKELDLSDESLKQIVDSARSTLKNDQSNGGK